jgi:hypothetical protein
MNHLRTFFILAALSGAQCSSPLAKRPASLTPDPLSLQWNGQSPEQRYRQAQRAGELHFLGIDGYARFVPGVDERLQAHSVPIVILNEGTDAFRSEAERKRYQHAVAFARAYNQIVLRDLSKGRRIPQTTLEEGKMTDRFGFRLP